MPSAGPSVRWPGCKRSLRRPCRHTSNAAFNDCDNCSERTMVDELLRDLDTLGTLLERLSSPVPTAQIRGTLDGVQSVVEARDVDVEDVIISYPTSVRHRPNRAMT